MKTLNKQCSVGGCENTPRAKGLCNMHYKRMRSDGLPGEVGRRRAANGEGSINAAGYKVFNNKNGIPLYEHRLVMEAHLGRKLSTDEHVHHIDGNKVNNDMSNLEIISNYEHQKRHVEERAFDACGNREWRICVYCHSYSPPETMEKHGETSLCHIECRRRVRREYWNRKRNYVARVRGLDT